MSCNPHLVLCHHQHLCCLSAELICWNNAAAAAGTGWQAALQLGWCGVWNPGSGLVLAFWNSKKLIYCRLLLLQVGNSVFVLPLMYFLQGEEIRAGFMHSKAAGLALWERVLTLFDNPFSCFLGWWMTKGRSGSSYSFSGMFFFPGTIIAYKMKQDPSDSINN